MTAVGDGLKRGVEVPDCFTSRKARAAPSKIFCLCSFETAKMFCMCLEMSGWMQQLLTVGVRTW